MQQNNILWESSAKNPLNNKPFFTTKLADGYYIYGERAGVDSVAFILYDNETDKVGLINEPKPPLGPDVFLTTAFGGSMDKDTTPIEIVQEEVKEESGYTVELSNIIPLGKVFVSTQMNQYCHLYLVDVTGIIQGQRHPDEHEFRSKVVWFNNREEVLNLDDWKAPLILLKYANHLLRKG